MDDAHHLAPPAMGQAEEEREEEESPREDQQSEEEGQDGQAQRKQGPKGPVQLKHLGLDAPDDDCSICLEEFDADNPPVDTSCQHKFHTQCIMQWQERSNCCPLCWEPFSLFGEEVPTSPRLPSSPLNIGVQGPALGRMDIELLIAAQLSLAHSHHASFSPSPSPSTPSAHRDAPPRVMRSLFDAQQAQSRPTSSSHPAPARQHQQRQQHNDRAPRGRFSSQPPQPPSGPLSRLRGAIGDVFDRLRARERSPGSRSPHRSSSPRSLPSSSSPSRQRSPRPSLSPSRRRSRASPSPSRPSSHSPPSSPPRVPSPSPSSPSSILSSSSAPQRDDDAGEG